jgi:hypothetical protein
MDGRPLILGKPKTYVQRAFITFKSVAPVPLTARVLAAILRCEVKSTYNYIFRLKQMKKIQIAGGTARSPSYTVVPGAECPPDDARGRKPSRPPTNVSRWKKVDA